MKIIKLKKRAELHYRYPRQLLEQPCYIELDCINGMMSAYFSSEIGNAVSGSVWHGHTQQWRIPCITARACNETMEGLRSLADRVLAGYESEFNRNHVAHFNDDARSAIDEIEQICMNLDRTLTDDDYV